MDRSASYNKVSWNYNQPKSLSDLLVYLGPFNHLKDKFHIFYTTYNTAGLVRDVKVGYVQ